MPFSSIPRRGLSPLWIIAIFLSFSETVLGFAVTRTTGGIQVALTTFVVSFPALVGAVFFLILWKKPYVFYPPTEFSKSVDVKAYVDAMQSREAPPVTPISTKAIANIETQMSSILAILESPSNAREKAARILEGTVEAVRESVLQIDSRPLFGRKKGRVWEVSFDPETEMYSFLNNLYFTMQSSGLPAYTYGEVWALKDCQSDRMLIPAGQQWAELNGKDEDRRTLKELGLRGGMELDVVALDKIKPEYFGRNRV